MLWWENYHVSFAALGRKGYTGMDDQELGRRIAYWRQRRGITQQVFADRVGRSKSWVEKVERGSRSADRLSVLDTMCEVLQIDLSVLIGEEPRRGTEVCIDNVEVERIRSALEQYPLAKRLASDSADLEALRRQLNHAWTAFEMADYEMISRVLPALVEDAQSAHTAWSDDISGQILAEVYQITASTLRKLGEHALAWLAGDRGYSVAQRIGDLSTIAATGFRIANALLSMGRSRPALTINSAMADRLEPALDTESLRALYGHVLLQGAVAAATAGDEGEVNRLIREASDVARFVSPGTNHHRLEFGSANVTLHEVGALVALGEGGRAAEVAGAADPAGLHMLRTERRAALLVDVARGQSQMGNRPKALDALLEAEQVASREVRCRPLAQTTIADLLRRSRGAPPLELSRLAERAGVRV